MQVALAYLQRKMSKGLKCVSAAMYRHADTPQANKQRSGALGSAGSPTGVLGANIGNPHRLTIPATSSDRQGTALEVKEMDNHIEQAAGPRARPGNGAPGNGKARKRGQWVHVSAHVNMQGNEVANGLAMECMCSSPLWSPQVTQQSSFRSESTVGSRGGSRCESQDTKALWSSLGMVPMDSHELTGEASGEPARRGMESCNLCSSGSEEMGAGHKQIGGLVEEMSSAETLSFSTDVSDTRRQHKRRKLRKSRNPGQGR